MSEAIITVENLGKRYRLGTGRSSERYTALRDVIARRAAAPFRALGAKVGKSKSANARGPSHLPTLEPSHAAPEEFWALKDVSFEVKQGEVLGIIGRNGAGKSTLLKILSRITEPTEGKVRIKSRVASLLEVGTGFHSELTGRENIFLNGAILGMSHAEIKAKFDEIVAFAETEKFLDTPIKRYSSGMNVRLAFAVAAHLEPEILIIDEVLAVGDAEFQKKCLGKMKEVSGREGRTVLLVSHQIATIQALCSRCAVLENGKVKYIGDTERAIRNYTPLFSNHFDGDLSQVKSRSGAGNVRFTRLEIKDTGGRLLEYGVTAEPIEFHLRVASSGFKEKISARIGIGFANNLQSPLFVCGTEMTMGHQAMVSHGDTLICRIPRLPLGAGRYNLTLFIETNGIIQDFIADHITFEVEDRDYFGQGKNCPRGWEGKSVLVDHAWEICNETTRVNIHAQKTQTCSSAN